MSWVTLAALATLVLAGCGENLTPVGDVDPPPTFDCLPNLDGQIDAAELPLVLDAEIDYLVSGDGTTVELDGGVDESGRRVFRFAADDPSAEVQTIAVQDLAEAWYAADMAQATFVVPAADASGLDVAYRRDENGLAIVGLASPVPDPPGGQTLLVYAEPVIALRFPIVNGDAYSSAGVITGGRLNGLPYNGTDSYQVEVDAIGRAELPGVTFSQAHRVRTDVEIAPAAGGVTTSQKQVSFYFECFGEIVRATSRVDESNANFTTAAELRRFAL